MDNQRKEPKKFDWLPAAMPGVAKLAAEHRATNPKHFAECWRRGMAGEAGWFFAREGPLMIGTPWDADKPDVMSLLDVQQQFGGPLLMMRPAS